MTMPTTMQIVLASLTSLKLKSQGETMISTAISGSIMAWVFGEIGRRIENSLSLLTGSGSASPLEATFGRVVLDRIWGDAKGWCDRRRGVSTPISARLSRSALIALDARAWARANPAAVHRQLRAVAVH